MKRSEINSRIKKAKDFFEQMNFKLPPWAYWEPQNWRGKYSTCYEIVDNMLGWDLTDFGSNDFMKRGLLLFTIRNGNLEKDNKPYAEKIMVVEKNQETPMHFHWNKMEDIINRGGDNLIIECYETTENNELSDSPVILKIDGIEKKFKAGETIRLVPGESICLERGIYHRFYGENDKVLVGEVSAVNDDRVDNKFYDELGRFPDIEEDEKPLHLLVSDYQNYL